jgi:hypothetical protein
MADNFPKETRLASDAAIAIALQASNLAKIVA